MKKVSVAVAGILAAALSAPALAGPNWDAIHEAEARHGRHAEEHVLPLDHGPRAVTTPWLNKVHAVEMASAAAPAAPAHVAAAASLPAAVAHN